MHDVVSKFCNTIFFSLQIKSCVITYFRCSGLSDKPEDVLLGDNIILCDPA